MKSHPKLILSTWKEGPTMEKNMLLLLPSLGKLDRELGLLSEDQRSALQATAESAHGVAVSRLLVVCPKLVL